MTRNVLDDPLLSTFPPQQSLTRWAEDPSGLLPLPTQQGGGVILPPMHQGAVGIYQGEHGGVNFISITNPQYQVHQRQQNRMEFVVTRLAVNIQVLLNDIAEMKAELLRLQSTKTFAVPLSTLEPEPFEMTKPIFVTVHGEGEDFTATFTEANISASGETASDAIANFKESLASRFEILQSKAPKELGPLPTRQWRILQSVVKRIE